MIRNYFTIAVRNLLRNKLGTAINILGLTIGITSFILIFLFVNNERSYDSFHQNKNDKYRVNIEQDFASGDSRVVGLTSESTATWLSEEFPEVKQVIKIRPFFNPMVISNGDNFFKDNNLLFAEKHFFDFFNFELIRGNAEKALEAPASVVITDELAKKLFGDDEPIGKTVQLSGSFDLDLKVTGIVKKTSQSHIDLNAVVSWNTAHPQAGPIARWFSYSLYSYLQLHDNTDPIQFVKKINENAALKWPDDASNSTYTLQSLDEIYLTSNEVQFIENFKIGNAQNLRMLSILAFFVLIIACVNYVNINTAKSTKRSKEVGLRKTLGAVKTQLIFQFMGEAFLLVFVASLLALLMLDIVVPFFNQLTGKPITFNVDVVFSILPTCGLILVAVTLLSGLYPAFILSAFQPSEVLKTISRNKLTGTFSRQVLITFQFVISISLIAGTFLVLEQINFLQKKELGFNKDQVIVLDLDNSENLSRNFKTFQQLIGSHANVLQTSVSEDALGYGYTNNSGHVIPEGGNNEKVLTTWFGVDMDFIETYDIEVVKGRSFSRNMASDSSAIIVNEAFVRAAGWEDPIQKTIRFSQDWAPVPVIGVVKDFHFQALYQKVNPILMRIAPYNFWKMSIKISGNDVAGTLKFIKEKWQEYEPNYPFEYSFVDQKFAKFYDSEQRLLKAVTVFSIISVIIACLGLYGLTSFTIEQRTKEIGIRKVLGASASHILLILNKRTAVLLLLAFLIALPITYLSTDSWLQNFAYRIEIDLWVFLVSGILTILITLLTVSYQVFRATSIDPASTLKYE
ncbi:ABC transporter permease [Fulvivirgaceae bacterium BMA10]|uniref:ABC transporter permease n=1 Tax=Splendidivirga corallicola TaxID=3051826 RepID=A0ABT8KM36_9BACT|nr:ABC transporter permease [Fulvivirgaceae bacterium BMA10]